MRKLLLLAGLLSFLSSAVLAQNFSFTDNWDNPGFNLKSQSNNGLTINYSVAEFTLTDIDIRGEAMKDISLPGHFLPNDAGAPNVPGDGRFIAIPNGSTPKLTILEMRVETIKNVNLAPAPRIPKDTERGPLEYNINQKIYSGSSFYPSEPIKMSEVMQIRGVNVVVLGVTPFQYNPATKELLVIRDVKLRVEFVGGSGQFGEDRYRSRFWDPIMQDAILNFASLPEIDYNKRSYSNRDEGCEYLIIVPDNQVFISWADTIKKFRNMQGIVTKVMTTTELGGNTTAAIESFTNNVYNTWDPVPAAILLMADYASGTSGILSPVWDNYCVSDHLYADVDGDDLEDIVFARMTAQNATHLETMVTKAISYEVDPPTSPDFYNHPITALGWQTERWFQICSETIGGYLKNVQGKDPIRINAVYDGNPSVDPWSTAPNTNTVLNYYGPSGLDYIPTSPATLGGWTGGNAAMVNAAINDGSYLLQHRDHGFEYGWGEPDYQSVNIDGLTNEDLCFVLSINCLTGKYNMSGECFTEKFHRYKYNGKNSGALGLIAASEVSYSFVNDTYVWGLFDNMYPDYMPAYGTTPESRGQLPAFGNTAGKYFLMQSNWPYNSGDKEVTINLFHHHGDAFTRLYSEVPQYLTVNHESVLLAGLDSYTVTADEGSLIALSVNGALIGTADGTGAPVNILIDPQFPPDMLDIVVTKENYYRYHAVVQIIPPTGPYIVNQAYAINDETGNNNGKLDYAETVKMSVTLKNVGSEDAQNVIATLSTEDPYVTIEEGTAPFGNIPAGQVATIADIMTFKVAGNVPNNHTIEFSIEATDGTSTWTSTAIVKAYAPVLEYVEFMVADPAGNNNGRIDPGETAQITVSITNSGLSQAYGVTGKLTEEDPFITITAGNVDFGDLAEGATAEQTFTVVSSIITPPGHTSEFEVEFTGLHDVSGIGSFGIPIGQFPVLIIDIDQNANSGPTLKTTLGEWGVGAEYVNDFPADISDYSIVVVCLGVYNQNTVLTQAQGLALKAYLEAGGNLYMEGGDTYYYDQQYTPTAVHPMFNIQGLSDGNSDLYLIKGQAGTFVDGMNFIYAGDNNYIDHIAPIAPAVTIFKNNSPAYDCVVAHDAGTYKTIGSVLEFSGLNDNTLNTKKKLMQKYLEFFGLEPLTEAPGLPQGETTLCGGASSTEYSTTTIEGATYYVWSIMPEEAGTVIGYEQTVNIDWNEDFFGTAQICVCGMNEAGLGPVSDSLEVSILELPTAAYAISPEEICIGDSAALSINLTGVSPWTINLDINGGTYQYQTNKPAMPPIYLDPNESVTITVESVLDGAGCVATGFEPISLIVDPLPSKPVKPAGQATVDVYTVTSSQYSVTPPANTNSYIWSMSPSSAGTMQGYNTNSITVNWNAAYTGNVTFKAKGINDCGEGTFSEELQVVLYSTLGISENELGIKALIFPNPTEGVFTLELSSAVKQVIDVTILTPQGKSVYSRPDLHLENSQTFTFDLSMLPEGIYFVKIQNDHGNLSRKLVINR